MGDFFTRILFLSDTTMMKLALGLTSLIWPLLELYERDSFGIVSFLFLLYGSFSLWKILEQKLPLWIYKINTFLGATIWTFEAWHNIIVGDDDILHIVLACVFALLSLWLLIRHGDTNKFINRKICKNDKVCIHNIIEDRRGEIRK